MQCFPPMATGFCVLILASMAASADDSKEWKAFLNRRQFEWPTRNTWTFRHVRGFPETTTISIHVDPQKSYRLKYEFFHKGKSVFSVVGHWDTAFAVHGTTVFISEHSPSIFGCVVSAYDLTNGRKLWSTGLSQNTPAGHSGYSNRVAFRLSLKNQVPNSARGSALIITGSESYCDYVEVLDTRTGKSLAIKNYRTGWRPIYEN